ncbi:MAG: DinB family protein, partial [Anaerolineales bacterium]
MKEGLEANRKICQKQQTELRHKLLSKDQQQDAFRLFFKQHAMLHSASMAQAELFSLEDEVFENLSEERARQIPRTSQNSIIWNIWHIARIEDVAMNMLVAGREQVFIEEEWQTELGIEARDTGNAMPAELILELSQNVQIPALRAYRVTVGRRTREIVKQLPPVNLKDKVDPDRLAKVQNSG